MSNFLKNNSFSYLSSSCHVKKESHSINSLPLKRKSQLTLDFFLLGQWRKAVFYCQTVKFSLILSDNNKNYKKFKTIEKLDFVLKLINRKYQVYRNKKKIFSILLFLIKTKKKIKVL